MVGLRGRRERRSHAASRPQAFGEYVLGREAARSHRRRASTRRRLRGPERSRCDRRAIIYGAAAIEGRRTLGGGQRRRIRGAKREPASPEAQAGRAQGEWL